MKLCQHEGCNNVARLQLGWRVWPSKAKKAEGPESGATGMLDLVVCEDHLPHSAKELMTEESKAMVNREFSKLRLPWPKWSTAEIVTVPL